VDVTALVTECAERAEITDRDRTWHTDIAPGLATTGDEELLRRAIDNLLANIRAHTPDHTAATLTAARHHGAIAIEISDDGPGVPRPSSPASSTASTGAARRRAARPGPASGWLSSTPSPLPTTAPPRPA
jgi:signal transduction histidine kinase